MKFEMPKQPINDGFNRFLASRWKLTEICYERYLLAIKGIHRHCRKIWNRHKKLRRHVVALWLILLILPSKSEISLSLILLLEQIRLNRETKQGLEACNSLVTAFCVLNVRPLLHKLQHLCHSVFEIFGFFLFCLHPLYLRSFALLCVFHERI